MLRRVRYRLHPPPRTLALPESSRRLANCPGGLVWERPVLETARSYWTARFVPFVSGAERAVPGV